LLAAVEVGIGGGEVMGWDFVVAVSSWQPKKKPGVSQLVEVGADVL
jgi:hypothetical protein